MIRSVPAAPPGPLARLLCVLGAACAAAVPSPVAAQAPGDPLPIPTPSEQVDYQSYTAPDEVVPYLHRLADETDGLSVGTLPGSAIPVARIAATPPGGAADGGGGPPVLRVLVVGAQHGTERAGLEVGLRLVRDLTIGRLARLRGRIELRVVPMANPWGVRNQRRATREGIDPARDHVRLAAAETRALWTEYAAWRPHLVLDLHELGPSEYPVQVGVPTHPNAPAMRRIARYYLLPHLANALARADVPFHEYAAPWVDGETIERAAAPSRDSAAWFTPPPLDPASARNAFALAGSVSFFIATASSRDIIGLKDRTDRLYLATSVLLSSAAARAPQIVAAHEAGRSLPKGPLALRARYVEARPGAAIPWIFRNEAAQREQGHLRPWRSEVSVEADLETPAGWWVAGDREDVLDGLRRHGFEVGGRLAPDAEDPMVLAYPHCPVDAGPVPEGPGPPPDAVWVPADQPGGRLLFTLIEPRSAAGWFAAEQPSCAVDDQGYFPVHRVAR